jgi:hypothetical protein
MLSVDEGIADQMLQIPQPTKRKLQPLFQMDHCHVGSVAELSWSHFAFDSLVGD